MKLGFIGVGNLAGAILKGVVASGKIAPEEILIYDLNAPRLNELKDLYNVSVAESANQVASECDNIVIAVKPKDIAALINEIKEDAKTNNPLIISTAAGTETIRIKSLFGYDAKVVRIMPNINAAVGESMTAACRNMYVSDEEMAFALDFCTCFGSVSEIPEIYFSAFTAVAGSAPAFAYMFADALTNAAVKYGLPAESSQTIVAQMLLGSAKMLLESPLPVSELIRNVCSPGGTTIEGVCSLKETGFENSVIKAIDKTVEKDRMMSQKK